MRSPTAYERATAEVQYLTDRTCAPVRIDFGSMIEWMTNYELISGAVEK